MRTENYSSKTDLFGVKDYILVVEDANGYIMAVTPSVTLSEYLYLQKRERNTVLTAAMVRECNKAKDDKVTYYLKREGKAPRNSDGFVDVSATGSTNIGFVQFDYYDEEEELRTAELHKKMEEFIKQRASAKQNADV